MNANRIINVIYVIIIPKMYALYVKIIYVNHAQKNANFVDIFFAKIMIAYPKKYLVKIVIH
jgi:hypothetical protein